MKAFPVRFLILSLFIHSGVVRAQWQPDGNPITTGLGNQENPTSTPDGAGGVLVTWWDYRNDSQFADLYAQRINATGAVQWTTNGVAVCTATNFQSSQGIVSDGAGGAIISWQDARSGSYDIYAQRVNASGVVQWTADGVALCTAAFDQLSPRIVSDGAGGAIVAWRDGNINAQRINASGVVQWTVNGVPICTAAGNQEVPSIVSDGAAGAIMTWQDNRGFTTDIYAQRVDASGVAQWIVNGVAVCTAGGAQLSPRIISDGAGGAIVTWYDSRALTQYDVYAQRVDASGGVQWTADGVALSTAANDQGSPVIVSDGGGGAIVTWYDTRSGFSDVYAQGVDGAGVVQWAPDGIAVCTHTGGNGPPRIASDLAGGAIVTWEDFRSDDTDIYAQRIDVAGSLQWMSDGLAVCAATANQAIPTMVSDGAGGAIVSWSDGRSGTDDDIYAVRVRADGQIPTGVRPVALSSALSVGNNHPNPFSLGTTIDVTLDHESPLSVDVYDVAGHRVRAIDVGLVGAGSRTLVFDGLDDEAHVLPSGIYFFRVHAGSETVTRKMVIER